MEPAVPEVVQPFSPPSRQPLRILRWRGRTQVFYEELGNGERLPMIRIPAGTFQMGSPEEESRRDANEGPVRAVALGEFLMARTPITQAQWRVVAQWQPRDGEQWGRELSPAPSHFQAELARMLEGESNTDNRPVEQVSWFDALEFCSRLSQRTGRTYTLPSEAQWEYAGRAGTTSPFSFGETIITELVNYRGTAPYADALEGEDRQQTTPVGLFPANAWGLHDMHGNVWEWCTDHWHEDYDGAPRDASAWLDPRERKKATKKGPKIQPDNAERVVRGGAWSDPAVDCRSACRYLLSPGVSEEIITGFRVVCMPPRMAALSPVHQGLDHNAGATVLWVDDYPENNRSERTDFEQLGIKILLSRSTDAALEVLSDQPLDLIISDMSRDGQPRAGLEFLKDLQDRSVTTPVVFYVGMTRPELEAEAMDMGAVAVLRRRDQLVKFVQSLLKK